MPAVPSSCSSRWLRRDSSFRRSSSSVGRSYRGSRSVEGAMLKTVMRFLLAAVLLGAGVMHFVDPWFFVQIMPPYLPWHWELVYVSGVIELVLGVALLIPATQRLAAYGAIALFIAVFPANIHMAMAN